MIYKTAGLVLIAAIAIVACNNRSSGKTSNEHRVVLARDTVNVVKLSDTLVIGESVCRGCAYEGSTRFDISDSLGLVRLLAIETQDDHPSDMSGGYIGKTLVLVPTKTGTTTFRMYKLFSPASAGVDSTHYISYTVTVQNP